MARAKTRDQTVLSIRGVPQNIKSHSKVNIIITSDEFDDKPVQAKILSQDLANITGLNDIQRIIKLYFNEKLPIDLISFFKSICEGLIFIPLLSEISQSFKISAINKSFFCSIICILNLPSSIKIIVFGVSLLFYPDFTVANPLLTITVLFLTSILFSLMGFINAVFADSFDDISIIPTFILTPLIYFCFWCWFLRFMEVLWVLLDDIGFTTTPQSACGVE